MERVWLRHPETGGFFHCPAEAVDDWKELGWVPSDPPPAEPSPVVAERIAWEREQQAAREMTPASDESAPEKKTTSQRRSAAEPKE